MERTHHTDTLPFKFSLSLSTSPISIRNKSTLFSRSSGSYMNKHTKTMNTLSPPSLNICPITMPNPNKGNWEKRLINLSIIPHVFLCYLLNYWWAARSGVSYSCEVFCLGKAALAKKISLIMSDVIPDPYNFTIHIYCRSLCIAPKCIHWDVASACFFVYKYVFTGQCHITRVAGRGLVLCRATYIQLGT